MIVKGYRTASWALLLIFVFSGIAFAKSGSDRVITEDRDVSGFNEVTVALAGRVLLEQGDTEGVTVEAESDMMEHIITKVRGRRLVIEYKSERWGWHFSPSTRVVVTVRFKDLSAVSLSGSADVTCKRIKGDELDLLVSGSGDILFGEIEAKWIESRISGSGTVIVEKLSAERVQSHISGSGDVKLTGTATSLRTGISGSGSIDASALQVKEADVRISGSGSIRVNVSDELTGTISGSGSLWYKGRPYVDVSTPGSGSVRPIRG
ncbi:MAG: head GIN domain-containing protein [bacterium]